MPKNNKTNVIYKDIETGVRYTEIPPGYKIADSKEKEVQINKELLKNKTLDGPQVILQDIVVTAPYKGKLQKTNPVPESDRETASNMEHRMRVRNADRFVHTLGITSPDKIQMNNLADLGLILGGTAASVPAVMAAPVATAGGFIGGVAGTGYTAMATNYLSNGKYKSWGDAVEDWTNGYIRADNAEVLNPGAWFVGGLGVKAFPQTMRGFISKLPNNWTTRLLYDASNQFGEQGILDAINNGKYIYNLKSLRRNLIDARSKVKTIKDQVGQINAESVTQRAPLNRDPFPGEFMPKYRDIDVKFLNHKANELLLKTRNALAKYNYLWSRVELPFYKNPRSNIVRDYADYGSGYKGNAWLAGHEFEHGAQFAERYGVSRPDDGYYGPNPDHPLYPETQVMKSNKPGVSEWFNSPDELMSEVMGYKIDNNILTPYHKMDAIDQLSLRSFIMKRFHLSALDAHNILNTLSTHGY